MFPLIDIGISLINMLLGAITPEGDQGEPKKVVASPVPARLTFPLEPPYYNLPEITQSFTLPDGLEFDVVISPKTFPEIYAFVKNGCRHRRAGLVTGDVLDVKTVTKDFSVDNGAGQVLTGEATVTVTPTYPPRNT